MGNKEFETVQWDITGKMDQIIEGSRKCNEEELKSVLPEFLKEGQTVSEDYNQGKKIPEYWLTVFKNAQLVTKECDFPILKHLKQIDIRSEIKSKEPKQPKILSLKLIFEENEFFENPELTCEVLYEHVDQVKKSTGCDIKWKPGKDITTKPKAKKNPTKKQRAQKKKGGCDGHAHAEDIV